MSRINEEDIIECDCGCCFGKEGEVRGHVDVCPCDKCHNHYGKVSK